MLLASESTLRREGSDRWRSDASSLLLAIRKLTESSKRCSLCPSTAIRLLNVMCFDTLGVSTGEGLRLGASDNTEGSVSIAGGVVAMRTAGGDPAVPSGREGEDGT